MSRGASRTVGPATPELSLARLPGELLGGGRAIPGTGPASQPPTLANPRDESPSGSKDRVPPWGWLQKAGAALQAPGRGRGRAPEPHTAGPGQPGPGERPAHALVHGDATRGQSTPWPAVRLPGLPAEALEGHLGVPAEETGGAWAVVGGRGGQAEAAQEAQLMEYAPAWGARRPEWTCPHLEKGPTSPGAAPPRPPAGHNGWSRQPHEVSKPTPWPAVGQAGPAGNSGARGLSVRSPAAGHPRLPLLALRPLVRPSPCPSVLGSGRCQGRGKGGQREEDSRRGDK